MREVKLHVSSTDDFFAGAAKAAARIDAGASGEEEAVIAFESMEVLLKTLTANRWRLLRTLRMEGPTSIRRLAQSLARDYRAVHADVAALINIGLIERAETGEIGVPWDRITAEMAFDLAA